MTAFGGWDDEDDEDADTGRPRPAMDDRTAARLVRSFRIVRLVNLGLLLVAAIAIGILAWLSGR